MDFLKCIEIGFEIKDDPSRDAIWGLGKNLILES